MFTIKCCVNVFRMTQDINDLELFESLGILEKRQYRAFHDEILKVHLDEFINMNLVEEFQCVTTFRLLWIVLVQSLLIFQVNE